MVSVLIPMLVCVSLYWFDFLVGATTVNGKLYVIGGHSDGACIKNCELYDPETDKWSEIAPLCQGNSRN